MKATTYLCSWVSLASFLVAGGPSFPSHGGGKPAAFFLAGDSTTAIQSVDGGGWGTGFLGTLRHGAIGHNFGHNGATTVSFVAGGDWAQVLALVAGNKTKYRPYVTIQFGHNDQKASTNISVAQYSANLKRMGLEVREAGGQPIFVTPLSRRVFNATTNNVVESLAKEANATIGVAKSLDADFIDLNRASVNYLNAIGKDNATAFNLGATDRTHLNSIGSVLFGNMVSLLLNKSSNGWKFHSWTTPNSTISADIESGTFIAPDVL